MRRSGACAASTSRCCAGRQPVGLPRLRRQVERSAPAGRRSSCSAADSSGTSRCGSTLVNHDPGPDHDPVGARDRASTASGHAGGSGGSSAIRRHPAAGGGHLDLAAHRLDARRAVPGRRRGPARPRPAGPRSSAAPGRGRPAAGPPSRARRRARGPDAPARCSPSSSHSATISRLPTAWSCRSPRAAEPVLQHARPGPAPLVVAAQRGQRHAAGRRAAARRARRAAARTSRRCRRR